MRAKEHTRVCSFVQKNIHAYVLFDERTYTCMFFLCTEHAGGPVFFSPEDCRMSHHAWHALWLAMPWCKPWLLAPCVTYLTGALVPVWALYALTSLGVQTPARAPGRCSLEPTGPPCPGSPPRNSASCQGANAVLRLHLVPQCAGRKQLLYTQGLACRFFPWPRHWYPCQLLCMILPPWEPALQGLPPDGRGWASNPGGFHRMAAPPVPGTTRS